jgi:hypothetical protein
MHMGGLPMRDIVLHPTEHRCEGLRLGLLCGTQRQVTQTDLGVAAEEEARLTSTPKIMGFMGNQGV